MIYGKNKCVKKCEEDNTYIYEFKNICYKECPENSTKREDDIYINEYFCKPICTKDKPFEFIATQECLKNCPLKDLKENKCKQNYKIDNNENNNRTLDENNEEDTEAQDIFLENLELGFTSEEYNTPDLDNGVDEVYQDEKMTVVLTTTKNQKNNTNTNTSLIDLGDCENLLREKYIIPDDELLYMKKIDVIQKHMNIPKVEYDVYSKFSGNKLVKLNLTVCEKSKISLSIPLVLFDNLDILNSSSGYYNDICFTASSNKGTDIILTDRKKEFVEGNKTVCQEGCDFSEYDYNTQRAKCLCKVKQSSSFFADMKINTKKLYENFVEIKNIANFNLMKCYKVLFNIKGIKYNIANYSIIVIILFHLIGLIIFYLYQKKILFNMIDDIEFSINNMESVKADKIKRKSFNKKNTINLIQNINKEEKNTNTNKKQIINEIKILPSNDS